MDQGGAGWWCPRVSLAAKLSCYGAFPSRPLVSDLPALESSLAIHLQEVNHSWPKKIRPLDYGRFVLLGCYGPGFVSL